MLFLGFLLLLANTDSVLSFAAYEIFEGFDKTHAPTTAASTTTTEQTTSFENITLLPDLNISLSKFDCPENEHPINIGPYEVPTQRDLTLFTRKTLKRMFGSYHQKALFFLDDIKKATRSTAEVEKKCRGNKATYRQCVKHISSQCEVITKSLVISLERQRHDVAAFSEGKICNMAAMKADPVKLVKVLAMEEASLEFALPAFLRLLSACSTYCINTFKSSSIPLRHLTDTDLVIRHFLTRKSYQQLVFS